MERLAYPRREWAAIARELAATYRGSAPPGLAERVAALLAGTPTAWPGQECELELDPPSAAVVRAVVGRGRGQPADPGMAGQQRASLAEADALVRDHQAARQAPTARGGFRVEHREGGAVAVVARTGDVHARQAELSQHAARLIRAGAGGELVLVDETTGDEVARRALRPDRGTTAADP